MLKCEIDMNAANIKVAACGSTEILFVDTVVLLQKIHRGIRLNNPHGAATYVEGIIAILSDGTSPFWEEEAEQSNGGK